MDLFAPNLPKFLGTAPRCTGLPAEPSRCRHPFSETAPKEVTSLGFREPTSRMTVSSRPPSRPTSLHPQGGMFSVWQSAFRKGPYAWEQVVCVCVCGGGGEGRPGRWALPEHIGAGPLALDRAQATGCSADGMVVNRAPSSTHTSLRTTLGASPESKPFADSGC